VTGPHLYLQSIGKSSMDRSTALNTSSAVAGRPHKRNQSKETSKLTTKRIASKKDSRTIPSIAHTHPYICSAAFFYML